MLLLAVIVLGLTAILGATMAVIEMYSSHTKPPTVLATLHGLCAVTGVVLVLLALGGPARGAATGTRSFGLIAAVLLLLAAAIGVFSLVLHWRRGRFPVGSAGAHAFVAVSGYVILAVYLLI